MDEVQDLVQRAGDGDAQAWSALVERFADLVWAVARSVGLSNTDAADVSQTTWLRFCEHLTDLRDPSRAGAWLVTTARREAVRVSRLGSRQVVVDPWAWAEEAGVGTEEPGSRLIEKERDLAVQYALAVMPERCRSLLLGTSEDPPVSYETLSEKLGIALGSVGPVRRRCLERLRRLIEQLAPDLTGSDVSSSVRS